MSNPTDQNVSVLANATELASAVIMDLAGDTIGSVMDGKQVTPSDLKPVVVACLQKRLAKYMGAV